MLSLSRKLRISFRIISTGMLSGSWDDIWRRLSQGVYIVTFQEVYYSVGLTSHYRIFIYLVPGKVIHSNTALFCLFDTKN